MLATANAIHRRASIEIGDAPDALVRVLALLRRRGCRVLAVDFRAGDRHRRGWLSVAYAPPPRCEHTVAAWLANLVDVTGVEDAPA